MSESRKTMRTAFIRVSAVNNTEKGIINFSSDDISLCVQQVLTCFKGSLYWYIMHPADDEVSNSHWHIVFKFKTPVNFDVIKCIFPYGNIESARSVKQCVQYLIHFNDDSKVQYSWDDIQTNCSDMTPYKICSHGQEVLTIEKVLREIDLGHIREYNQYTAIDISLWSKYKTRIENALLYYRERVCMDKDRIISVVFFSGETGVGKTTFAKQYCIDAHKSFCISSSSNDPLQDYKGEDVLILDDLRDDSFSFTDLLKILDNHTKSTIKSRYHNKAFIGDTILITSYRPIVDWYFNVPRESKEQLFRRVSTWFKFTMEKIECFTYDEMQHKYIFNYSFPNIVKMSKKSAVQFANNMLSVMGITVNDDVRSKIDNAVNSLSDSEQNDFFTDVDIDESQLPFKI